MKITITREDLAHARSEGSVIAVTGTDQETGDRVTFGGDWRPMENLMDAMLYGDTEGEIPEHATVEVEGWQVIHRVPLRVAQIRRTPQGSPSPETADRYLPANYRVASYTDTTITIEGHDVAGWTLDDYVIPRLASGLIWCSEVLNADGSQPVARFGAEGDGNGR